ncbi:hypothetical protein E2C01_053629 [Portunus trituberculatus]|uniref:Uncharacterized protein n=1 Tax=Portunus trituberculatus TaxID=210409 RepID=A0A5B7GQM2_PORTR|nr:hypothetical protein [Portunus trituberculatus]
MTPLASQSASVCLARHVTSSPPLVQAPHLRPRSPCPLCCPLLYVNLIFISVMAASSDSTTTTTTTTTVDTMPILSSWNNICTVSEALLSYGIPLVLPPNRFLPLCHKGKRF